jgi:hypothetical protein
VVEPDNSFGFARECRSVALFVFSAGILCLTSLAMGDTAAFVGSVVNGYTFLIHEKPGKESRYFIPEMINRV